MSEDPTPGLGSVFGELVSGLGRRGRSRLDRGLDHARSRLELRQLERDRDHFWVRLGKTAYRLAESGEVQHPDLERAVRRIQELEAEIVAARAGEPGDEAP